MVNSVRQFLAPPVFPDDEDKTRAAQVLNTLLLSIMGILVMAGIATPLIFVEKLYNLIFGLMSFSIMAATYWIMWRGRVRLASAMFVSGVWIVFTIFMPFAGGITSTAAIFYIAGTVIAGLLLGERAAQVYAAACCLAGLGMVVAETNGHLPLRVFPMPARAAWLDVTLCLLLTLTALNLTLRSLRDTLVQARHNERALAESNRKLEAEIAERKQAEEALRESEAHFRILAEGSIQGILVHRNTQPLFVNQAFANILGYESPDEILNMESVVPLIAPYEQERLLSYHQARLEGTEAPSHYEYDALYKDGSTITLQNIVTMVNWANESAVLSTVVDVTERKQMEEALRQYTAELEARNKDLDAFAHTVAHDLKNPLAHIFGFAEALEEDYASLPDEELRRYLHMMAQNGRKMSNIIDELLLLASVRKMEEVPLEPLDMASIVGEAQERLSHIVEEYQAEIVLPDAWPEVLGYGPWVEEVWANYLSNAIKYGGQPPRIELGFVIVDDEHRSVRFWVRDSGLGLTSEEQGRLFRPFTRLSQVRSKGYGLGLSIVWRIVERLGGEVGVESVVGQGSEFYFTLPAISD